MASLIRDAKYSPARWTRGDLAIVAVLAFVGMTLRIPGLNGGLWYDEILTLVNVVRLPVSEIIGRFDSLNNHVFYSLCAHFSVRWFGETAWALRLPALVFGIASLPALYLLGRQITDRREALLAAVLMSASYHHVWFSQNARGYTGLALGALLASILFICLLKTRKYSPGLVLAYAATAALTMWIHMTAVFVTVAHGLIAVALAASRARREPVAVLAPAAVAVLLSGLLTLALYSPVIPDVLTILSGRIESPNVEFRWYEWGWFASELLRGAQRAMPGGAVVAILAVVAVIAGVVSYLKQSAVVGGILTGPMLLTGSAFAAFSHTFFPRFLFVALPFLLLIAVRGGFVLASIILPFLNRNHVFAVGITVALASAAAVPAAWQPKQDFVAAAAFIEKHREVGDAVVCADLAHRPMATHLGVDCVPVANAMELEWVESHHERTWFVYSLPISLSAKLPDVWDRVQAEYTEAIVFEGTLGGGDVVVMSKGG